ncbi:cupin domain-containing protein [Verticiella sediminum]|uniref:Cupin domain-containing protein n=1 Tax=Verticiella sediminum TaxID=1247510 RepID=A0A556ALU4_9BURK|nr:cupin domain-containing protein [Verticiella sediminum]TSH93847.1 cupin domain-containing protein [Verticiella sediminum]
MSNIPISTPTAIANHLIVLGPEHQAALQPFARRAAIQGDWMIGLKPFAQDADVHADHWERHAAGDEILMLLAGRLRVVIGGPDSDDPATLVLEAGHTLRVARGHWHGLSVIEPGQLLFITPAQGTEHRSRKDGR